MTRLATIANKSYLRMTCVTTTNYFNFTLSFISIAKFYISLCHTYLMNYQTELSNAELSNAKLPNVELYRTTLLIIKTSYLRTCYLPDTHVNVVSNKTPLIISNKLVINFPYESICDAKYNWHLINPLVGKLC